MLELEQVSFAQREAQLAAELAATRDLCLELRLALGSLCMAVEAWGQWTMSHELAQAIGDANAVLTKGGSLGV